VSVISAAEAPLRHLKVAAFNPNCLAIDEGIGQFLSSRLQHPMKRGAGNTHLLRAGLLLQPFHVLKAYGLCFLYRQTDFLQKMERNPYRLEVGYLRQKTYATPLGRSRHRLLSFPF